MRVLVLDNLLARTSRASLGTFLTALAEQGARVEHRTRDPGQRVEELASDALDFDRVVAAGGDGTVSSVAYHVRGSGVPLLAYPAGTANLIAANLGLPTDPVALADAALRGRTLETDLGELEARTHDGSVLRAGFAVAAGTGFDAEVMRGAHDLKPVLGVAAYYVSALQHLVPQEARFLIDIDDVRVESTGIAVLVVNFSRIQLDIAIAHDSSPTDGVFEVVVVQTRTAVELLPALLAGLIDGVIDIAVRPGLDIHRGRSVQIQTDPPLTIEHDGDLLAATTPLSARVLPGAASFIVM